MPVDFGKLILRLGFGATMLMAHGWGKIANFSQAMDVFPDPLGVGSSLSLGLAISAEVFCAFLLTVGLFTRWVSIPLIMTMFVAFFLVHASDPWAKKEMALIYMTGFTAIGLLGGGRFSLDFLLRKKV